LNGHEETRGGEGTIDSAELLMSVMEARELVEETGDAGKLQQLQIANQQEEKECIQVNAGGAGTPCTCMLYLPGLQQNGSIASYTFSNKYPFPSHGVLYTGPKAGFQAKRMAQGR
ncbi:hypothetical protein MMC29_003533, partial [Sticta canariensis]|nr:hypothetical protein [Sticta canariensis]